MRNLLAHGTFILLMSAALTSGSAAQDIPYRSGAESYQGQSVNVYTNAGAAHYRRAIQSSRGTIYNAIQKRPPTSAETVDPKKIPVAYSYRESGHKSLGRRTITVYRKEMQEGRLVRVPTTLDLSEIIVAEAKRHNLDPLLVEIVIRHESAFNPYAVSRTGAQGLMQLMPGTAAMLGVSDSFDPRQNVAGGVRYLADQLARFKNLGHALAAYNAGPGAVQQFGGIPPYAETHNYVRSISGEYALKQKKASES